MPDISEAKTFFTGDISDYQAKARLAQQITEQTTASMNASLKVVGTGITSLKQPISGIGTEFQKLPSMVKPPLGVIEQAFKQLGIQSQQSLQTQAAAAQKAFNTISLSGKSSAEDIIRAQKALDAALSKTQSEVQKTGQVFQQAEGRTKSFADKMQSVRQVTQQVGTAMIMGGAAMSAAFTVPFVAAINAGRDFESAFAGVRKTVNATPAELAVLRQSFRDLSKEMPTTAVEFAKIGEAAGQLGVKQQDILQFSKVMADLGVTTNLTSDQASTALARFANIIDNQAGPQFDRLGATIVALGNAGASTEAEIVEMALRIAGAGKQAGLSESDILAFANALSSVGIEAEAGGSSMSRLLIKISDATKLGRKELQIFAQVAGQSAAQFQKAFQEDAGKAVVSFIEGLGKISASGKSLTPTLEALGLSNIRVSDALLRASGAGDLFRESLDLGSRAWIANNALTKEAAERYKTFDSQIQIIKNRFTDIGITIFDELRPAFIIITDGLKSITGGFTAADPVARKLIATLLAGLAVAGPVALGIGAIITLLGGPLAIAIVGVTAGISVLFAESVSGAKSGTTQMGSFKDSLLQVAQIFGVLLDAVGAVTNGIGILVKAVAFLMTPFAILLQVLVGDFKGAWQTFTNAGINGLKSIGSSFDNMMADVNGRWSNTLTGMVQTGFNAAPGFGAAGSAAGIAFSNNLSLGMNKARFSLAQRFDLYESGKKTAEGFQRGWLESDAKFNSRLALNANLEKGLAQIKEKATKGGADAGAGLGAGFGGAGSKGVAAASVKILTEVQKLAAALSEAARSIVDGINQKFREVEVGKILQEKIAPAVDRLKTSAAGLRDQIIVLGSVLDQQMSPALKTMSERAIVGDGSFEALINRMIDMKRAGEVSAKALDEEFKALSDTFKDLSSQLPTAWNTIIDGIIQGSGKLGSELLKFGNKIKGDALLVLNVFDTLPGKWGDSLRKGLDEVNKWINFIDSALKLLQRIMGNQQTGLAGIFDNIAGSLKQSVESIDTGASGAYNAAKRASQGLDELSGQLSKSGDEAGQTAGKWISAIAGVVAGISMFVGSRHQGLGQGILGGALGGFTAGAAIGSIIPGLGTLIGGGIGALIGGIAGLFGTGKSGAQKQAEADAARAASVSMQETSQRIANAALDGMLKGFEVLEKLDEFTKVHKSKFVGFFSNMKRLMDGFVAMARQWSVESFAQAQAAAEAIGPVADAISKMPEAFNAINGHFGVAQSAIDRFFADFDTVMTAFFARSEVWIDGISKRAMKVANRLTPVVSLISGFAAAVLDIGKVVEPDQSVWGIFDRTIESIVSHVAALSEKFDKAVLKVMANFAEKSGGALSLWSAAVEAIKSMVDIPMPTEQDFTNVFSGIEKIITGMTGVAERLSADGIAKASSMATASLSIFSAIKAGVEALTSLKDYKGVLVETFTVFEADFDAALRMLESMSTRAMQFDTVSKTFESYIASGAASLSHAFTMLSQIMNAAGAFFPSWNPLVVPGGESQSAASAPASFATTSGFAPMSFAPMSAPLSNAASGFNSPTTTTNHFTIVQEAPPPSALVSQEKYDEYQRNWWRKKKARALGMNINIPDYLTE